MMISHHRERGKDNGLDRVSEYILIYQCRRKPRVQPMVTPESDDEISDEDFTIVGSSTPLAEPLSSADKRNRSRIAERSRSRERVYPRSSSHASQQQVRATGARAKRRSRARKDASAKEVRGYYKQFAEAKHLEYKSWVDNEVFDLVDLRKVKPRNYITGRWVLTIKTDKQGKFLTAKARLVLRGLQEIEGMSTDRFPCYERSMPERDSVITSSR